jgi:hypothetical protein
MLMAGVDASRQNGAISRLCRRKRYVCYLLPGNEEAARDGKQCVLPQDRVHNDGPAVRAVTPQHRQPHH